MDVENTNLVDFHGGFYAIPVISNSDKSILVRYIYQNRTLNAELWFIFVVYLNAVTRWMSVLLTMMRPLLYNNGGPIISVQVWLIDCIVSDWLMKNVAILGRKWVWQLSCVSEYCFSRVMTCQYLHRCDHDYMGYLRDIFLQYLGENVVLFTVGMYALHRLGKSLSKHTVV